MTRGRFVIAGLTAGILLGACGGAAVRAGAPGTARGATASSTSVRQPQTGRLLMAGNRQGVVAVDAASGKVTFRGLYGVAAPDASTIVQAEPIVTGTRVVASDPRSAMVRWSYDVAGTRRVRVVSPGGARVALVDGTLTVASSPRASTTIEIVTTRGVRPLRLVGNFDPEAFSVDGRYLFALEFLPALNPSHYSVRRIDLRSDKVEAVPDRDGTPRHPMAGYSRTQLMSPDGRQLYTFYASTEPIHEDGKTYHAFVHVLNLANGWAFCVDLDERIGAGNDINPALAVSPDGATLYATDGSSGLTAVIDTATLATRRVAQGPIVGSDSQLLTATDGATLYVGHGDTIDRTAAATLRTQARATSVAGSMLSITVDAARGLLYVATNQSLLVLDRGGRTVSTWPSPGDATSIDPAATVPGSGAYQCAC